MSTLYRPVSYYATDEECDARALARFRIVTAHDLYNHVPPPDDDDREGIDRALTREAAAPGAMAERMRAA
jgi:hypothetical protein